jgi:hypothetical protein
VLIGHQDGNFSLILCVEPDQSAHSQDLLLSRFFVCAVHHEGDLALTVNMTNANQALVRNARAQAEGVKVAHVHTAARKRLMELRHPRFVIGADRPKRNLRSISHGEL